VWDDINVQILVTLEAALLTSARDEFFDWNTNRDTGITLITIRAIEMRAASPKPVFRQPLVRVYVKGCIGVHKDRSGGFIVKITALVGRGGVEAYFRHISSSSFVNHHLNIARG